MRTTSTGLIRRVLAGTALLVAVASPLVAAGFAVREMRRLEDPTPAPVTPVTISPIQRSIDDSRPVVVEGQWQQPAIVYAPDWSGTVTALAISVGDRIRPLDVVVQVDGIDRLAWQSDQWFHRGLRLGDVGIDVAQLQRLLVERGSELPSDRLGVFGVDTREAVRSLEAELGIVRPSGTFDPAWLIALPAMVFEVGAIEMVIGNVVPGAGDELLTSAAALSRVEVTDGDEVVALDDDGEWVVELASGVSVSVRADGTVNRADWPAVFPVLSELIDSDSEQIDPGLPGTLRRAKARLVWAVPTQAIRIGVDGTPCLYVKGVNSPDYRPMFVEPSALTAEAGTSLITAPLDGDTAILVNPAHVLEEASCE